MVVVVVLVLAALGLCFGRGRGREERRGGCRVGHVCVRSWVADGVNNEPLYML